MKKFTKFFSILLIAGIGFVVLGQVLKAASIKLVDDEAFEVDSMAYAISCQMGEDASTEAGINYLSLEKGTYALVTEATDTTFANAKRFEAEYIDPKLVDENCPASIQKGYRDGLFTCEVDVTGLTPNTRYAYKITNGKNESEVCYFKTAPADGSSFSFGYLTDPQLYGTASFDNATYKAVCKATNNIMAYDENGVPGINFILGGGDMTNNGGDGTFSAMFFSNPSLHQVNYMSTAGNHEYNPATNSYLSNGSRWYVMHANNPKNGTPELERQESTWWVKYGDTLIINLTSSENTTPQIAWMEEVILNNPAQWIICLVHYNPNSLTTDPQATKFVPTFDKYGVDLVLYGHHHTYDVKENYYNHKKRPTTESGTMYFQLAAAYQHTSSSSTAAVSAKIDVTETGITLYAYDIQGRNQGTFGIAPKRGTLAERSQFDEKAFVDSISVSANQSDRTKATLTYSGHAYENVKSISLKNTDGSVIATAPITNDKYTDIALSGLTADKEYDCLLEYVLKDGTIKSVDFKFDTNKIYGTLEKLEYKETSSAYRASFRLNLLSEVKGLKVYLNGEFYSDLELDARLLSIPFVDFKANSKNEVVIKGVLEDGKEVLIHRYYYGEDVKEYTVKYQFDAEELTDEEVKFVDPSTVVLPTPTREGYKFLGWYEGETKVESLTEARDYQLTAKWEKEIIECEHDYQDGTCTKCGEKDPDYKEPCEHNFENGTCTKCGEKDLDYKEPEEKGGCNNAASVLFTSLMLLGLCLIRRRKW